MAMPLRASIRAMSCGVETMTADRKSTRLNSSHDDISYAVFCLKKNETKRKFGRSLREPEQPEARCVHIRIETPGCGRRGARDLLRLAPSHYFFFLKGTGAPEIHPLSLPHRLPN